MGITKRLIQKIRVWLQFAECCFFYISLVMTVLSWLKARIRTALFWVITQRVLVIPYRQPIGPIFKAQEMDSWPFKKGPMGCPETSVRNYHYSLRNNPEERSSHLLRGGRLKPGIF
jgi:hypothetical protein